MRTPRAALGTLLVLLLVLTSCVSVSKTMESWVGSNINDLMASWGPPQQVFDDGSGGRVIIYTSDRSSTSPGYATTRTTASVYGNQGYATSTTTYTPAVTNGYTAYRMFWIDGSGTIYRWAWKGL